ncbi:MAG: hypothetical protein QXU98_02785 [Candidatus Parvarchaeota archaeon]
MKWNVKSLSRSDIKRTKNKRSVAVYNQAREKDNIARYTERVSIVKAIIASNKKGSISSMHWGSSDRTRNPMEQNLTTRE